MRHGANTQLRQFKDLACFGYCVIKHFHLTGAATGIGKVRNGLIDLCALTQGGTTVALLSADVVLAGHAQ